MSTDDHDDGPSHGDAEAALRRCEAELQRKTQALKALDHIVRAMMQDFQTCFMFIIANCSLLEGDLTGNDEAREILADLIEFNQRPAALISGIQRALSPPGGELPCPEIEEAIEAIQAALRAFEEVRR
jgi:hypothetical protein